MRETIRELISEEEVNARIRELERRFPRIMKESLFIWYAF